MKSVDFQLELKKNTFLALDKRAVQEWRDQWIFFDV